DKNAMEQYRQEMMRLYGKSTIKNEEPPKSSVNLNPEPKPEQPEQEKVKEENNNNDIINNTEKNEENRNNENISNSDLNPSDLNEENMKNNIDEKYPDPVIDEILKKPDEIFNDAEYNKRKKYDSIGWISVDVRTGENASPVQGASVIITSIADGNLIFKATRTTDESGQIKKIALPTPSVKLSMDSENNIKPYSTYDINVYADGFFRERSIDVPVFSGITSVQQFNMVPVPLYMSENDENITYYNQEPEMK
ncbi:MAG: hypothetical protein K2G63_03005, partial [Oscillospiraceae bacterium]|nr:hypothetical protein [Oscillospiraceae bacterium]